VLGLPVSDTLEADLEAAAADVDEGGVRIRVTATCTEISVRGVPSRGATTLRPLVLPGGLGAHKWADRRLIDAHSAPAVTPLVCDLDGSVLEAGYAAVLLASDGALIAPPLDGRLLASVSRDQALRAAHARGRSVVIARITLDDVRAAKAIILTSSLRGPHPGALEGAPAAPGAQALCEDLA
jgi:para-aminobenzoate synthetase/4-amino-4-deoxychorismate lyase